MKSKENTPYILIGAILFIFIVVSNWSSRSNDSIAIKDNKTMPDALDLVVDLDKGTHSAWLVWEDQGGLNTINSDKLHGVRISYIATRYFSGEAGNQPAYVEMKTDASPVEMRSVLAKVCGVSESEFIRRDISVSNGEVILTKGNKKYTCYYEQSPSGDSTMLVMGELIN